VAVLREKCIRATGNAQSVEPILQSSHLNQIQVSWTNSCAAIVIEKEQDLLDKIEDLSEDKIKSPPKKSGGFYLKREKRSFAYNNILCPFHISNKFGILLNMKFSTSILIIGIWLIMSPWILGFFQYNIASWNAMIVGIILIVLSFSRTITKK